MTTTTSKSHRSHTARAGKLQAAKKKRSGATRRKKYQAKRSAHKSVHSRGRSTPKKTMVQRSLNHVIDAEENAVETAGEISLLAIDGLRSAARLIIDTPKIAMGAGPKKRGKIRSAKQIGIRSPIVHLHTASKHKVAA